MNDLSLLRRLITIPFVVICLCANAADEISFLKGIGEGSTIGVFFTQSTADERISDILIAAENFVGSHEDINTQDCIFLLPDSLHEEKYIQGLEASGSLVVSSNLLRGKTFLYLLTQRFAEDSDSLVFFYTPDDIQKNKDGVPVVGTAESGVGLEDLDRFVQRHSLDHFWLIADGWRLEALSDTVWKQLVSLSHLKVISSCSNGMKNSDVRSENVVSSKGAKGTLAHGLQAASQNKMVGFAIGERDFSTFATLIQTGSSARAEGFAQSPPYIYGRALSEIEKARKLKEQNQFQEKVSATDKAFEQGDFSGAKKLSDQVLALNVESKYPFKSRYEKYQVAIYGSLRVVCDLPKGSPVTSYRVVDSNGSILGEGTIDEPFTLPRMDLGEMAVKLEFDELYSTTEELPVQINSTEETEITFTPKLMLPTLQLWVWPEDATIRLTQTRKGSVDVSIGQNILEPGKTYTLEVTKRGYRKFKKDIKAKIGETYKIDVLLYEN